MQSFASVFWICDKNLRLWVKYLVLTKALENPKEENLLSSFLEENAISATKNDLLLKKVAHHLQNTKSVAAERHLLSLALALGIALVVAPNGYKSLVVRMAHRRLQLLLLHVTTPSI